MRQLSLILFFSILLVSCKPKITVDELCSIKSKVEGEYATYNQVLYLIEDNDTVNMEIDTMHFKIDKKTKNRFKLKDQLEYEAIRQDVNFDVERYIYLKPSNDHEAAWSGTLIQYKIPAYTDWIKCICTKDMNTELLETIRKQLNEKGYESSPQENLKFEGAFKEVLIEYQKEHKLPYGNLNTKTLKSLGIKVREK